MAKVKILVEGYTFEESGQEKTCSTVTLIKDENLNIIVDPGTLKNQQVLVEALKKENLTVNDIDIVFVTHLHIDHCRNVGMFPKAKVLVHWGLWDGDTEDDWEEQFTDDIKIIRTLGHCNDGLTFLIKTEKGTIAICGDVFWKEDFPKNDPFAVDREELEKSRKKVLRLADYVIPGHAGMFKVEK